MLIVYSIAIALSVLSACVAAGDVTVMTSLLLSCRCAQTDTASTHNLRHSLRLLGADKTDLGPFSGS